MYSLLLKLYRLTRVVLFSQTRVIQALSLILIGPKTANTYAVTLATTNCCIVSTIVFQTKSVILYKSISQQLSLFRESETLSSSHPEQPI